ncbi:hypothetical protein L1286_23645 [Pseudoalteromonas sp. SMS1]|uniref:hypothetical protein n=1 Tax=Pseudoalteromonas sp. SMS1 TaxID=2908894 RepID=UPI001F3A396F|nr:hypothetical protein [Pseudoalteromonas sp. SMS1]MCF2860461.1 hypothetical protein [Pseudoalteromonas sp. SMS1]
MYIKLYRNRVNIVDSKEVFNLESDLEIKFNVFRKLDRSDRFFIVQNEGELIEVGAAGFFSYYGQQLKRENGWGWVYKGYEKGELRINTDQNIYLNNEKVGYISSGGGVFEWLKKIVSSQKVVPFEQWCKVEFNNELLDVDAALSLLFIYHSQTVD